MLQISICGASIHQLYTKSILQTGHNSLLPDGIVRQPADDLALPETMRAKIREVMTTAKKMIKMLQVTDAGLKTADSCLDRMKELATKAMDDTLTDADRLVLQREINITRADMERNAYQTNEKIREMVGLPKGRGSFEMIDQRDVGFVSQDYQKDQFNTGRYVYDEKSENEFVEYLGYLHKHALETKTQTDADIADTMDTIYGALRAMRPADLGVDKLDVTTVEKARESLTKISLAKEKVARAINSINREIKKWVNRMYACGGIPYTDQSKQSARGSWWQMLADFDIAG